MLLVECKRHIYVNVEMFNYCFIRISDYMYMLVFVMVFVSRSRRVERNVMVSYRLMLCRSFGVVSLLLSNFDAFCEWFC